MKERSLLRSTGLVSTNTMISRVLGFIRDMVVANVFGATAEVDAFLVAFKLPNFMRRLFAEGAFSQAFVPVLSEYQQRNTQEETQEFINRITGCLASVLFVVTVFGMIFSPLMVMVFAPGFDQGGSRFHDASGMLRITFSYLFFISLTALCSAVLNTYRSYGVPAFTPVFLNITMIVAAIWGGKYFAIPIYCLAWGVFFAGIIQLVFQLPFMYSKGLMPMPKWGFHDPGVRRVMKLMVPALFGVSVAQISLLLDTIFASFLKVGSVSWLYYSDRLTGFPLGVFGVAVSTVILPYLSRSIASKNHHDFSKTLDWSLRLLLLIGVPSSVGLGVLSGPLLAALLHYGHFNNYDVLMTQQSTIAFAIGVQGFMLVKVLAAGFYARQNIKTPVKVAAIAMVSNMVMNFIFIFPLKHAGLALATSLAGYVNSGLLLVLLLKYKIYEPQSGWRRYGTQLFVANSVMAFFLWIGSGSLQTWLSASWEWRLFHLVALISLAFILYFGVLKLMGMKLKQFRIAI